MQKLLVSLLVIASIIALGQSAATLQFQTSDTVYSALFGATGYTGGTSGTAAFLVPAPTAASTNAAVTASPSGTFTPAGSSSAYTVTYKSSVGIPFQQVWTLTQDSSAGTAIGFTIAIPLGPQVSLTVTPSGLATSGTLLTSASAVTAALTTCGNYYIDCTTGYLTFNMYVSGTASQTCIVTILQVNGLTGGLAYATALPTGAQANLATAITANSNGVGSPNFCGTTTNSGNTVYLFTQPLSTSATSSDLTTAAAKLTAAIKAKTAFTGSARLLEESDRVLATSYTLVNGYAQTTAPSTSAGITAYPSSTASAALAANATSQSRVVVIAGLLTTVLAAVFGLAL